MEVIVSPTSPRQQAEEVLVICSLLPALRENMHETIDPVRFLDEALLAAGILAKADGDYERWHECENLASGRIAHRFTPSTEPDTDSPVIATLRQKRDWVNLPAVTTMLAAVEDPAPRMESVLEIANSALFAIDDTFIEAASATLMERLEQLKHVDDATARTGLDNLMSGLARCSRGKADDMQKLLWDILFLLFNDGLDERLQGICTSLLDEDQPQKTVKAKPVDVASNPYL